MTEELTERQVARANLNDCQRRMGELRKSLKKFDIVDCDFDGDVCFVRVLLPMSKFVEMNVNGDIVEYEHNRGLGKTRKTFVNELVADFNFLAVAMLGVEDLGDGHWKLFDGHHRTKAILERYEAGLFSEHDLDRNLIIQVCEKGKGLELYRTWNKSQMHNSMHKLANPDMIFGALKIQILKLIDAEDDSRLKPVHNPHIAAALMAVLSFPKAEITFKSLSRSQRYVAKHMNTTVKDSVLEVSEESKRTVADAVKYVLSFYDSILEKTGFERRNEFVPNATGKTIIDSSPFFVYLLFDQLMVEPIVTWRSSEEMASIVLQKSGPEFFRSIKKMSYRDAVAVASLEKTLGKRPWRRRKATKEESSVAYQKRKFKNLMDVGSQAELPQS